MEPEPGDVVPYTRGAPDPTRGAGLRDNTDVERPTVLKIKFADGKQRTLQSMVSTTFWSADGKPMSAVQFLESLFGVLPALFSSQEQLRTLWSVPETRTALLGQLSDAGFGREALSEMQAVVSAEDSDLYDLLAFVAYATPMVGRAVRAAQATKKAGAGLTDAQQAFVAFVLDHYVREGVDQLDADKLPSLLKLKYGSIDDATAQLGPPGGIRKVFLDFQRHLYETAPLP